LSPRTSEPVRHAPVSPGAKFWRRHWWWWWWLLLLCRSGCVSVY